MSLIYNPFKNFQLDSIKNNLYTFNNYSNNYLYIFASRATSYSNNDITPDTVVDSFDESVFRPSYEMMFGKKLNNTDIAILIKQYVWTSGTIYDQYDNSDTDLFNKSFFVATRTGGNLDWHVYKCLWNNNDAASTINPDTYPNGNAAPFNAFQTSDGYIWKYMFFVSNANFIKFNFSNNYIPYFPPTSTTDYSSVNQVQLNSKTGIDVIKIVNAGNNYTAITNGIIQSVDTTLTGITLNTSASQANNIYTGSHVLITNISDSTLYIRGVSNYYSNNYLVLDSPITGLTPFNYTYNITPKVSIAGDGSGALAYSTTTAGRITQITVANTGSGYTRALVTISANSIYGSGANTVAIIPPPFGHGNNAIIELGADAIGFVTSFAGSESNTIPTDITYRTVGLLRNPSPINSLGSYYTSSTFDQTLSLTFTNPIAFSVQDTITGSTSQNVGIVTFSNTTLTTLVGDKKFVAGETVTNSLGTTTAVVSTIAKTNALQPFSGQVLYINNINKITRTYSNNETIQIAVQL